MDKPSTLVELQQERRILDAMIEKAIDNGIRISKDQAIIKQSQKVNKLITKYHKENPGTKEP